MKRSGCITRWTRNSLIVSGAVVSIAASTLWAQTTVYEYRVPSGGYDPMGNLITSSDSISGDWTMSYDTLNRLGGASSTAGIYDGISLSMGYDSFGNRTTQQVTSAGYATAYVPQSSWAVYDTNGSQTCPYSGSNRLCATPNSPEGLPTNAALGMTAGYDAAGNLISDGVTYARYDGEGRMCASYSTVGSGYTQYFYDAEGNRVAKATASSFVCPGTSPPAAGVVTAQYLLGPSGEQVTELDGKGNWVHSNIYAGDMLLATYKPTGMHFPLTDPLGSTRVEVSGAGQVDELCANLPFGDGQNCSGPDATEQHFTGQERDAESGLDHFPARYYQSSYGRWASPDPSGLAFADPTNPQTLNLYSYVLNGPTTHTDPSGLFCGTGGAAPTASSEVGTVLDNVTSFLCNIFSGIGSGLSGFGSGLSGFGSGDPSSTFIAGSSLGGGFTPPPMPALGLFSSGGTSSLAPNNPTTCPAVPFTITGVGPNQAPGITAITQTPRSHIPVGGVAIKLDNFRTGSLAGTNWRPVIEGITLTAAWGPGQAPAGIPTLGPYSPVDTISANGVVATGAPNQIDLYGYTSQSQAFASTRTVMVKATIPTNSIGVRCPVAY